MTKYRIDATQPGKLIMTAYAPSAQGERFVMGKSILTEDTLGERTKSARALVSELLNIDRPNQVVTGEAEGAK